MIILNSLINLESGVQLIKTPQLKKLNHVIKNQRSALQISILWYDKVVLVL